MSPAAPRAVAGDRRAPSRGDQQRARIIASATALLNKVSVTDLSVMQIAKNAGVTRPVFYFYFESKYAVVAAALELVWNEFDAARNRVSIDDLGKDPTVITRQLVGDAESIWRRHGSLLNACVLARSCDPQLDAMWRTFNETQKQRIIELLRGLRGPARIRPTSDDFSALIDVLLGMTVWALIGEDTETHPVSMQRRLDAIAAVWLATVWGQTTSESIPPTAHRNASDVT